MVYRIRKLIEGWQLGKYFAGKQFVAIPKKLFDKGNRIEVRFGNQVMYIEKGQEPVTQQEFDDKFNRGTTYILYYYEWKPEVGLGI